MLKFHLLKPLAELHSGSRFTITGLKQPQQLLGDEIPEGETRILTIICNLAKVLEPEVQLKVHLAIEDQFGRKHKLPPIMVKSMPTGK